MMAEFVQTMNDWIRMCGFYKSCESCPMFDAEGWAHVLCSEGGIISSAPETAEKVITAWVAEHPEPVYPTWDEWLTEMGILQSPLPVPNMTVVAYYGGLKAHDRIPADIAEKLGIEPKEAGT